jgi:UDP-N-acetylglucosamine:LPS N-acetylglucosamine transferase
MSLAVVPFNAFTAIKCTGTQARWCHADIAKAARDQNNARHNLGVGSSFFDEFFARLDVAAHLALRTVPYPVLVANAALYTVEQLSILLEAAYKAQRRQQANNVLKTHTKDAAEKRKAHADLVKFEDRSNLLYDSLEVLSKCGASTIVEIVFAATGTVVSPGIGTWLGQQIGAVLTWLV